MSTNDMEHAVAIPSDRVALEGVLTVPPKRRGVVVFSHGSGSGRNSPRNRFVASEFQRQRMATLLLDLLTESEDAVYERRFDIDLLTRRLGDAARFVRGHPVIGELPTGLFGASTGAASALRLAAAMPGEIAAVVSRGGRPDLTGVEVLGLVRAPTLLIVGGSDHGVIQLNEMARDALTSCERQLVIVPGATHLFEESGTLQEVARLATDWFARHFTTQSRSVTQHPS
jgi:pimeloyl-ACP methyl ester carboxylesterase